MKYFDKTFFKFLGGFALIIIGSLVFLIGIGVFNNPFSTPASGYDRGR